jgi:Beta-lactamase class C and other penicillin binding proteins
MRFWAKWAAACAVSFVVFCGTAVAQDAARMDEIVQSYVKSGKFMGAVLVEKDGKPVLDKGYGFANLEWQQPNTPGTKFRLGSITKQFTSAAIYILQERGKLKLDDPMKKYIPEAPPAWDKITIHQLLTHTAGLPNFTDQPEYMTRKFHPAKPDEIIAWFKDKPLDFDPGSKEKYSNSGYVLLGRIIEKASGEGYAQFIAENIFKPLGMKDSGYDSNSAVIAYHAQGYQPSAGGMEVAPYIDMTVPFAAGGLYSTTHDLAVWDRALFGGKLLKPESLEMMLTPVFNDYASGLIVKEVSGHRSISHSGGIEGFNTRGDYLVDDKLAVIVLANLNGGAPDEIGRALVKTALGQPVVLASERKAVALEPAAFDVFAGTYRLAPQFTLTVSRDGDHFMVQGSDQPKIEVFPSGPREFFAKAVEASITFEVDGSGHATKLILHQNGRDMAGIKE